MMSPNDQKNTLFVRNLSPATLKSDLDSHFGGLGPLRHTTVVTEPGTEKCKGFGFVAFAFQDDAQNALKSLNGSCIRGRKISLDIARKRERRGENDLEISTSHEKRKRTPLKRKGAKKGSLAMRTVLLTTAEKDGQLTEQDAKLALDAGNAAAGFEDCVMSANSTEARCTFSSWALAGKAAALAHGSKYHAAIEALQGGKRTTVIVRNLPFLIDENELKSRFQSVAPLRELRLAPSRVLRVTDNKNGKPLGAPEAEEDVKSGDNDNGSQKESPLGPAKTRCGGYAFVEYFLAADAKFAITKMNGIKLGGRVIAVDLAIGKNAYEAQEQDEESGNESSADGNENDLEAISKDKGADGLNGLDKQDERTTVDVLANENNTASNGDTVGPSKRAAASTDEELSRTVFVRNLLFETSAAELWKAMEDEFGKVEQAVLVIHPVTKRPRGTAFVRFMDVSSAKQAVERAGGGVTRVEDPKTGDEAELDVSNIGFCLHGRQLLLSNAVNRSKAKDFEDASRKRKDDDPRNLRLAWIGMVRTDSHEAKDLSKDDVARRTKAVKEKRLKLERNPNIYVSDVRLCVRNLPKDCDEKLLKHVFLCAAQEKAQDPSEKHKKSRSIPKDVSRGRKHDTDGDEGHAARVVHVAIARDPQRNEKSKGYGFVQYERHDDAFRALMFINNNPKVIEWLIKRKPKALKIDLHRERLLRKQWGDGRRLMVEFALEDTRKVRIIERIKERGRELAEEHKRKRSEGTDGEPSGRRKKAKKQSENDLTRSMSKSERRAALKRERATSVLKKQNKTNKVKSAQVKEQAEPRRDNGPREASTRRNRDELFQNAREAEGPDPKPKKPKKKRKATEVEEDVRFDRILLSYKRKLAESSAVTANQALNEVKNPAETKPRWFE